MENVNSRYQTFQLQKRWSELKDGKVIVSEIFEVSNVDSKVGTFILMTVTRENV